MRVNISSWWTEFGKLLVSRFILSFKQTKPHIWGCLGLNSLVYGATYNKQAVAQTSSLLSYLEFCFHDICSHKNAAY